jgi:large subunit ribosomal protein L25
MKNNNNYIYTMKSITIKGSERESVGKVATKALRNAGFAVLYGGDQPVLFSAKKKHSKLGLHSKRSHSCDRSW